MLQCRPNYLRYYTTLTVKSLYDRAMAPPKDSLLLNGWIKSVRVLKKVAFIDLQDGTTNKLAKIVIPNIHEDKPATAFLKTLRTGQSISVKDAIWKPTSTRQQSFELHVGDALKSIGIVGNVSQAYPLQKKYHSLPFLRTLPVLKHRTTYLGALLRFRSHIEYELMQFFHESGFTKVSPPILTSSDCEGAGELFQVKPTGSNSKEYFGKPTFLTVSTQLHLEILALALSRCYTLTPCFRAEKSDTNRHLSEFWMLEAELCFVNTVTEVTTLVEAMIKHVIRSCKTKEDDLLPQHVPEECDTLDKVRKRWDSLLALEKWPSITYTAAIDILRERHLSEPFKFQPVWGAQLQSEHEKWLATEYFESPLFVTDYPRDCKAFYMKSNKTTSPEKPTVACFDLLVPEIGEIVGGSLREHDVIKLAQEMSRRSMNKRGEMDWYLNLNKEGFAPHGGFGLGMERLISYLFGNHNIRDAIPFHRTATGTIDL